MKEVNDTIFLYVEVVCQGFKTYDTHTKHHKAQQLIQPYLHKIYEWDITNNLHINTDKTITSLFTPGPAEYGRTLSLKSDNQTLLTTNNPPKFLELLLTQN